MDQETELNVSIFEKLTKITKRMTYLNSWKYRAGCNSALHVIFDLTRRDQNWRFPLYKGYLRVVNDIHIYLMLYKNK